MMIDKVTDGRRGIQPASADRAHLKLKKDTVGTRIAKARSVTGMTQQQVADRVGRKRSAVAQWERDDSEPSYALCEVLAEILGVRPEYIAFGVTGEPIVVAPEPEELGYALVPEITFGDTPYEMIDHGQWGLPFNWLRTELQVAKLDSIAIFKVEAQTGTYEYGDRVILDRSMVRVSPPGYFLIWDGLGPIVAHVSTIPSAGGKKLHAKVSGPTGDYEIDVDKLVVLGKVRGMYRKG